LRRSSLARSSAWRSARNCAARDMNCPSVAKRSGSPTPAQRLRFTTALGYRCPPGAGREVSARQDGCLFTGFAVIDYRRMFQA
jgi:hypothetical protein